jgi:hypothetical protein
LEHRDAILQCEEDFATVHTFVSNLSKLGNRGSGRYYYDSKDSDENNNDNNITSTPSVAATTGLDVLLSYDLGHHHPNLIL